MAIPQLTLGSFNLTDWSGSTYGTSVIAQGTSKGAPVPLEVAVKSWLQNGSIVVTQGYDNRTVNLRVKFRAPSLTAVAAAEAAFFAQIGIPNTLTWTPASGPASVFVVVTSSMEEAPSDDNDLAENQAFPWRTYNVRLLCEAFVRSVSEVVAAALPATGSTTTLVNDGSATTGWAGLVDGVSTSPTVVSGAVRVTGSSVLAGTSRVSASLTAAITTSSTKYIVVDWKPESTTGSPVLHAYGDGVELSRPAEATSPTAGYTRSWFGPVAASSIAVLKLEAVSTGGSDFYGGSATRSIYVDNVNRTDVKPAIGTNRQLLRAIDVTGGAPTNGSVAVEHASSALGDTIIYACPETKYTVGYSPPLRQYRVSGGTVTADSTMVSGSREDAGFATTMVYDVPVAKLAAGLHVLALKGAALASVSVSFSWSAQLRVNSTNVGPAQTGSATRSVTATQAIYTLGRLNLPPTDLDEAAAGTTSAVVRISLTITGMTSLDEVWIFNTTIGTLIGPISCGTAAPAAGGSANRLFLEPATPARSRPTLRIGFAADRSDAYFPGATSGQGSLAGWQLPTFDTPRMIIFTVTTNALDASVSFRYYPRWFTNAAS